MNVQPEDHKERNKVVKWVIGCGAGVVLFMIIVAVIAGTSSKKPAISQTTAPVEDVYSGPEVVYQITGTAMQVDITLSNASGGTEQFSNVQWSHVTGGPGYQYTYNYFPSHSLYISAQNQGESGTVIVNIYYMGKLVKTATSEGAYVIVTASGYK